MLHYDSVTKQAWRQGPGDGVDDPMGEGSPLSEKNPARSVSPPEDPPITEDFGDDDINKAARLLNMASLTALLFSSCG